MSQLHTSRGERVKTGRNTEAKSKEDREDKGVHIGEEERKWSPFTHDMIVYIENSKTYTKNMS